MSDMLTIYTNILQQKFIEAVEEACDAALIGGTCGVFVLRAADGSLKSASPHRLVPYGQIYEAREPLLLPNFWGLVENAPKPAPGIDWTP